MLKIYNDGDTTLGEFAEEMESRNPIYIYTEGDYILVSDVEIDEDDVENVMRKAIEDWEEENGVEQDFDYDDD